MQYIFYLFGFLKKTLFIQYYKTLLSAVEKFVKSYNFHNPIGF